MKKILYSLLTLAAALTVASCQKEPANPDPIYGGKTVETTFTVALDQLPTKTYADGTTADKLFVLVYGADGLVASQSKTTADDAIQITNLKASYTVKFVKGQKYDIVFWAQAEDAPFSIDLTTGKLTIANSGPANAENRDAFWYVENDYEATANDSETVTLKRPFAQINVLLAEEFEEGTLSEMTVEGVPNVFDLLSGETSGTVDYSFAEAGLEDVTFNSKNYASGKAYAYAGMNYVLVPKDETLSVPVSFKVTCKNEDLGTIEIEKSLTGVPLKRNYRTNITYSPTTSKDYKVIVSPTWDGTNDNISADAQANEFDVIVGGSEFQNGATLELALNESKTVTIKDANDMAPDTAESEDEDVVTVTPTNEAGTYDVAAVAEGTANVNFHIDGYTKQDVQGADFTIVVKVGDGIKKDEQSIAWSAETATAKIGAENTFPTLDAENAKGAISYTSSNTAAATINAETGAITLVAAGETTITATAAAATVEGVQYAEATASYELTVSEADAPAMKDVTITVTEPANKALSVEENKTANITATAKTADNENVAIVYTSGDTSIATVDNGVVTGVAEGSTKITLTTTATDVLNAAEPVEITVTVTAAPTPGGPIVATVAEFLAAEDSETQKYQLTGTVSGSLNTTYGNFDLVDETGSVYVYGLTATDLGYGASNDKSFANLGIKSGDTVTLIGYRYTYVKEGQDDKIEVVNAYYVDHVSAPYLTATPATKTVNATETEVTWTISSNQTWTITPGSGVTASPTTGTGDNVAVTLSFAANNTSETKTYTATAKATGCDDVTITITQNGTGTVSDPRYEKVASASTVADGRYLIIWDTEAHATVSGKDLAKTVDVTIEANETIKYSATTATAEVTITAVEGGYTILLPSGKYLSTNANANQVAENANAYTFVSITADENALATILGKDTAGNDRIIGKNDTYYRAYTTVGNRVLPTLYKYTKIEVDCAAGSSNGLLTVSKLVFTTD